MVGARQTGKTSLLLKLRHAFRQKYAFVFVDLQPIEGARVDECFEYIAREMSQQGAGPPANHLSLPTSSPEFLDFLQAYSRQAEAIRIAILIDEVGALPERTADKLAHTIRAVFSMWHVKPDYARYVFILSGATDLLQLTAGKSSPLWNVTDSIYLADLTLPETEQVVTAGFYNASVTLPPTCTQEIYAWTGGHPYWTQLVAATATAVAPGPSTSPRNRRPPRPDIAGQPAPYLFTP